MSMWQLPRPFGRLVSEQFLEEGNVIPWGYGIAWACPYTRRFYCLPIPLNRIAGCFRSFWLALRRPCEDDPVNQAYVYGHNIGFRDGQRHGEVVMMRLCRIEDDNTHASD